MLHWPTALFGSKYCTTVQLVPIKTSTDISVAQHTDVLDIMSELLFLYSLLIP